jgi:hypothetical protein
VAGLERRYRPGDAVIVPAGVPHAAWTADEDDVHVLVDFRPALRTEIAFETLAALARDGTTTAAGVPRNPLRLALVLRAFEKEIRFVRPPMAVQNAVLGPLAAVGRMLGYGAEYPYRDDGPTGIRLDRRARPDAKRGVVSSALPAAIEAEPRQAEAKIAHSRGLSFRTSKHVQA